MSGLDSDPMLEILATLYYNKFREARIETSNH